MFRKQWSFVFMLVLISFCSIAMAESIVPIPILTCREFSGRFDPAYLSNGMIGTRPGPNPLLVGRSTMVSGFVRDCEWEPFEMSAKAPYPFETDIVAGGHSLLKNPEKVKVLSQSLDMNNGELTTKMQFIFNADTHYDITVIQFAPRTLPSVMCQRIYLTSNHDTGFEFHAKVKQGLHQERNKLGVAVSGHADQGFSSKAGQTVEIDLIVAMVSELYHPDPFLQARRVAGWAKMLGFDKLRQQNRQAWEDLWKSRIKVYGDPVAQKSLDAAFFYVQSSSSPFCLTGVGPYGFSNDTAYFGHGFWDMDHWVFQAVLLTNPKAAKAMMEYRWNNVDMARKKAATFGFDGFMFSWEASVLDGSEVTPSTAETGWAEHHVIPGVALAFWECALALDDDAFLQERAWPVLKGCAEWIHSRGIFTEKGFEIQNVMGVDEHVNNIDNNAHMNLMSKMAMSAAVDCAKKVGLTAPSQWRDVVTQMYIPVHPTEQVVIPYDDVVVHEKAKGYSIGSAQFLVFHDPPLKKSLFKRTFLYEEKLREMMDPAPNCPCSQRAVGFPCPTIATCAAMFSTREKAAEIFKTATLNYILSPYMTSKEYPGHADGNFITNQGSQLQAGLLGFTGLRIRNGNWVKYKATLPAGWEKIEIDRIWVKGRPMKLTAVHGKKAKLTPVK